MLRINEKLVATLVVGAMMVTACSRAPGPEHGEPETPYIALHLAYTDSATGRLRAQHGDSIIYLAHVPVLSDNDLASVDALARHGRPLILSVHCLPAACARLAAVTGQHVGTHLAVLVGSQVRGVAPIAGSVGAHGSLTIPIDAAEPESDRIVEQVRSRWPVP